MTRLVVLSLEPWDDVWRRNQYVVDGMLRADPGLQVLFVEPSNDLLHSAVTSRRVRRGRGLRTAEGYEGRLHLLQPDKLLPRVAGPAADALLRRAVRRAMRRLGFADAVLWVNDPSWAGLVQITGLPSMYDMTDDWLAAQRPDRELARIAANERVLMAQCAAIVVCSEGLRATRSAERDVVLIPNGVDVARYRLPVERPGDLAERSAVYMGTLHEDRLDVDLVLATADALGPLGARVALVGPSALGAGNARRLAEHPSVDLLGPRPSRAVPSYLQHATALIVPHVVDAFTDSLDPIKLYEYQAVGRPVVSTRVAGFRDADDDLVTAVPRDGFPDAVADAVRRDPASVTLADVPDWSVRVEAFQSVLEPLFGVSRRA